MSRSAVMFRQNSKVEKIPDDESEELLSKKTDEDEKSDQTEEASLKRPNSQITSNNFVRALSRTSEKDENTTELTLNGNLHIIMPNTDETCGGAIKLRKDNCDDTEIDIEPDEKLKRRKQKGWCSLLKLNCSKQTILNIVYGLLIISALIIGIKALIKYSEDEHDRYFYCYPCQNMNIYIKYTKRVDNMCCTDNPVEETALPKSSPLTSQEKKVVDTSSYNGTRILEFQANFDTQWERIGNKDIIPWTPVTNMDTSFVTFIKGRSELELLHDGNYVITLSLTTDTFSSKSVDVRAMACLVFQPPFGENPREECRQITHADKMVVPFQIFKFDSLRRGTVLHAFILSSKGGFKTQSTHNKLYLVLL
ncbi:uncharacterized protein LOC127738541 [Mytilus californianus]|uniref:uncharacterized protein LOC127738541 n=1 Tax=Mytilus californianus TaxID=6549 RepID=UPI002246D2E8|nr:uncharacterized protein LOC127738541 [Mytilus californianus]